MASDSFAAHLKTLGAAHVLPKPAPKKSGKKKKKGAESGSSRQETEGTGTSSANLDLGLREEDPEPSTDVLGVESPDLQPKLKRMRPSSSVRKVVETESVDPGKSPIEVLELDVEEGEGTRVVSGSGKPEFGRYSLKKVIGLMSELPSDQDWETMEEQGLVENFKGLGSLWAEVILLLPPFFLYFMFLFLYRIVDPD